MRKFRCKTQRIHTISSQVRLALSKVLFPKMLIQQKALSSMAIKNTKTNLYMLVVKLSSQPRRHAKMINTTKYKFSNFVFNVTGRVLEENAFVSKLSRLASQFFLPKQFVNSTYIKWKGLNKVHSSCPYNSSQAVTRYLPRSINQSFWQNYSLTQLKFLLKNLLFSVGKKEKLSKNFALTLPMHFSL